MPKEAELSQWTIVLIFGDNLLQDLRKAACGNQW